MASVSPKASATAEERTAPPSNRVVAFLLPYASDNILKKLENRKDTGRTQTVPCHEISMLHYPVEVAGIAFEVRVPRLLPSCVKSA